MNDADVTDPGRAGDPGRASEPDRTGDPGRPGDPGRAGEPGGASDPGPTHPGRELRTHEHGALVARAAVRHLGADPATIRVRSDGDRVAVGGAATAWDVEVADPAPDRPFTLLEFEDDLTPVDDPGPQPTVAVVGDGRSFLLSETAGLAGLIETAARETEPGLIADLVLKFADDRVEHVVTGLELTDAGVSALRAAGVTASPPTAATEEDGTWRLRFVTAHLPDPARSWGRGSVHGSAPGGVRGGVDFREWIVTIRGTGGGVDWQARPVALQVAEAVDVAALFARNRG